MAFQGTVGVTDLRLTHEESDSIAHATQLCEKLTKDESVVLMSNAQSWWFLPPFFAVCVIMI